MREQVQGPGPCRGGPSGFCRVTLASGQCCHQAFYPARKGGPDGLRLTSRIAPQGGHGATGASAVAVLT